jgi:hypothetical protein
MIDSLSAITCESTTNRDIIHDFLSVGFSSAAGEIDSQQNILVVFVRCTPG